MAAADSRLERWLADVVATPGLTAIRDLAEARRVLLEDALRGVGLVARFGGPIVDVGSGGGTPGIPLAASLPGREVALLEANERKCDFLRRWEGEFPNVRVVRGRAEEQAAGSYGVAVAKALAPPVVAAEWTLALVAPGGAAILWVGAEAGVSAVQRVAALLGGGDVESHDGLLVLPKVEPTPEGFPRRVGVARKRPLA
jgi:16S rRNA (guanine527-N7)-methyltransferase